MCCFPVVLWMPFTHLGRLSVLWAETSKHLLFAIPCSAHPESTGFTGRDSRYSGCGRQRWGAYDDVSRCRKQESLRVLLSFYRLHSLLFTCDFDCLKLSSLKSWVSKAPGFLLPYLTSSSPAHLFSILGLVSPTRSQGSRETERPKSDFWLRKKVNICFLTTSPDPNSLAYCFKRRNRLSGLANAPALSQVDSVMMRGQDPAYCALSAVMRISSSETQRNRASRLREKRPKEFNSNYLRYRSTTERSPNNPQK